MIGVETEGASPWTSRARRAWAWPLPGPLAAWLRALLLPAAITGWALHGLALPGYVMQVDAVFGPRSPLYLSGTGAPLVLIAHLLGGAIAGRLFVGGALYLCGLGPMVLLRKRPWVAQVPAGILGALNPWVYDRLIEGQWGVAAAAGVLFLWLGAWEGLESSPRLSTALRCSLLGWAAAVLDPHALGPILILAVVALVWKRAWRKPVWIMWAGMSFVGLGAMLLYAVPPFFFGHGSTYASVERFGRPDLTEFRSTSGPYGLWPNLVGLFGFWPERLGRIPSLVANSPWWPAGTVALCLLTIVGAIVQRRRTWLLAAGLLGLGLAGSTATPPGQEVILWLINRAPLLGAFREPDKFGELWLLAVVVLSAETLAWVRQRGTTALGMDFTAAAALVMVGAAMLPTGIGVLRELPTTIVPTRYPPSWLKAADYLQMHVAPTTPVLVLPWTLYEELPFTGNLLTANPAAEVFPGNLVSPDDIQIPGVVTEVSTHPALTRAAVDADPNSCDLERTVLRLGLHWAAVEPAPGGLRDGHELLACGFHLREGSLSSLSVLHGP